MSSFARQIDQDGVTVKESNMKTITSLIGVALSLLMFSLPSTAEERVFTEFGDYKVLHTVFNSSFIQPDVAKTYNLTRGKDRALINVSVVKDTAAGTSNGLAATITGTVSNLMQQTKTLEFQEISEQNAVYYLAPLRVSNEEVLHFTLQVLREGHSKPYTIKFTKKLYVD